MKALKAKKFNEVKSLTKLEFVRHLKAFGGTSKEQILEASKDTNLEFFWLMFDMATTLEKNDPEIQEGLDALVELGYLPEGKVAVIDNWPQA
tara:strand:- start:749 stop:1024 length:276 start_codon:yes stop_codon:yes gene_type:complete